MSAGFSLVARTGGLDGHSRIKTYDNQGRLEAEYGPVCDQTTNTLLFGKRMATSYSYYSTGQIHSKTEGIAASVGAALTSARSTEFVYDADTGRQIEKHVSWGSPQVTERTVTSYKPAKDGGGIDRVEVYGTNGQLRYWKQYGYDPATRRVSSVSSPEGVINYLHNDYGELTQIKTTAGQVANYTWDEMGHLISVSSNVFAAGAGQQAGVCVYSYDAKTGRKTKLTRPNGVETGYAYDSRGWVKTITHSKADAEPYLKLDYQRYPNGLIHIQTETRTGEDPGTTTWTYDYDGAKRLISAVATGSHAASYSYTYDKAANRTSQKVDASLTSYSYNSLNQLVAERTGASFKEYAYDAYGNLVTETSDGGATPDRRYTWDGENHLVRAEFPSEGAQAIAFEYSEQGARVGRKATGFANTGQNGDTRFLVDTENPTGFSQSLAELDPTQPTPQAQYAWGDDLLSEQSATGETGYILGDHLGSNRLSTSQAGTPTSAMSYTPFGEPKGTSGSPYRFTGQYRDPALGLQYQRARWLNTAQAAWLSQDPVFDWPGNFGNAYGYCGCNPANATDRSGTSNGEDVSFTAGEIGKLATLGLNTYNYGDLARQWAMVVATGGDPLTIASAAFWTVMLFLPGCAIFKKLGATVSKFGNVTVCSLGSVVAQSAAMRATMAALRTSERAMWKEAESLIGHIYQGLGAQMIAQSENVIVTGGRRIADWSATFLTNRVLVEVKHWSPWFLKKLEHNPALLKNAIQQFEKDLALAAEHGLTEVHWHFTSSGLPNVLLEEMKTLAEKSLVKICVFNY